MFANPSTEQIAQLLRSARTIAVVGLSADQTRPSHGVARALQRFGYRIIPVTPTADMILGEQAVPDLAHLSDGVIDETAAERARGAGIFTVMDRCLFRDRSALR
jgi:predicted CoA-binding protein